MSTSSLYKSLRESIVSITSNYVDQQNVTQSFTGSGFLIRIRRRIYVVTTANLVLLTNVLTPMTSIFAGFYNYSGVNKSLALKIVGVDASANVAVLDLVDASYYRYLKNHHFIQFANSRKVDTSDYVCNISNPLNKDLQTFTEGSVRDYEYFDVTGRNQVSCVVTDLLVYASSSGSPLLNRKGQCIALLTFGFVDAFESAQTGFSGGCDSRTLRHIVHNIVRKRHVVELLPGYVSHVKGYLGPITYLGVTNYSLTSLYPTNYEHLQLRGIILTSTSSLSPLSHLLYNEPPLAVGDIIVWGQHNGNRYYFGNGRRQQPLGNLLWFIDPLSSHNKVSFGVIRSPSTNSRVTKVKTLLNTVIDPSIENVPSQFANRVFDPLTPQNGEIQITGSVNLISLGNVPILTPYATTFYNIVVQDQTNPSIIYAARLAGGQLFYLPTPLDNTSEVVVNGVPVLIALVTSPPSTLLTFGVNIDTVPMTTLTSINQSFA